MLIALTVGYLEVTSFDYEQQLSWMFTRFLTQLRVVVLYLGLLVYPHPSRLSVAHEFLPSQSLFDPITTLLAMILVGALLSGAIMFARERRVLSFATVWFFLHLCIEAGAAALQDVFEHRLYLPMFGFALGTAFLCFGLPWRKQSWPVALSLVVVLTLGMATYARNRTWQDEETLWTDLVAKNSVYLQAHLNTGLGLAREGRVEAAIGHFSWVLRARPDLPEGHRYLANVLFEAGRAAEAVPHYEKAIALASKNAAIAAMVVLARILASCDDEGIRDGARAVELGEEAERRTRSSNPAVLDALAAAYAETSRYEEAARTAERGIALAATGAETAAALRSRLDLYRARHPYRAPCDTGAQR